MLPLSLTQPVGFGEIVSTPREVEIQKQLHALAVAIYQAKQRNDKADAAALLVRFQALANELASYNTTDLTPFDNFVLATGQWIETSVDAIPRALAALPAAVGGGLIQAAIPFAVLFAGYVLLRNWGRK